jgi:hypothetical protein
MSSGQGSGQAFVYSAQSSFKASFIADFSHRPQVITMTFCKAGQ